MNFFEACQAADQEKLFVRRPHWGRQMLQNFLRYEKGLAPRQLREEDKQAQDWEVFQPELSLVQAFCAQALAQMHKEGRSFQGASASFLSQELAKLFRHSDDPLFNVDLWINTIFSPRPVMDLGTKLATGYYQTKLPFALPSTPEGKAHQVDQARLNQEFQQDLFAEYGVENHPKRQLCFQQASNLGHSGDFNEVFSYFDDLVKLISD